VHADKSPLIGRGARHAGDRERTGVRGQHRIGAQHGGGAFKDFELDVLALGGGLDDDVGRAMGAISATGVIASRIAPARASSIFPLATNRLNALPIPALPCSARVRLTSDRNTTLCPVCAAVWAMPTPI
jgi:hypothetical protein